MVKKAAARANCKLGELAAEKASAIEQACDELIVGRFHEQFVVDVIQGGAGTSTNMNANEVIANIALELLGHEKGEYQYLHPNDDVNMAQSTNDAYPTAVRLAILLAVPRLVRALDDFAYACKDKSIEFSDILKMGRTQMQDAVPMTLGQEFDAYYTTIHEEISRLHEISAFFREINLGATAIGTGITADPRYAALAVEELAHVSGQEMVLAANLIEATSDMGAFVLFSGLLKRTAVKLSKICNDLRLLSSGPRAGFAEIMLPPMQAGSSIMPGKVNPVIPEVVNQVAFLVIGNDLTVTLAAEGGQLQLNAFEPTIGFSLLQSVNSLTAALGTLTERCIKGIKADRTRLRRYVENSIGLVTALNPVLGYERSVAIAKEALERDASVYDLVLEKGWLSREELDALLRPESMTQPNRAHHR
jgi:aspartate ammonia-lyase